MRELVAEAARADPDLRAEVRTTLVRPPFEIATDAEIVRLVCGHAERVLGHAAAGDRLGGLDGLGDPRRGGHPDA